MRIRVTVMRVFLSLSNFDYEKTMSFARISLLGTAGLLAVAPLLHAAEFGEPHQPTGPRLEVSCHEVTPTLTPSATVFMQDQRHF